MKNILLFFILFLIKSPLLATPQAVIFDFGGVLNLKENRETLDRFIQKHFLLSLLYSF